MRSPSLLKGLSWLLALNLLVKPVWIFFIDRQVQNIVGNEAYGRYFAVLNLSYLLLFLADAGLSNLLNQRLASGGNLSLTSAFRLKAFLLVAYILACVLAAWLSGLRQWEILTYVLAIQALNSLFLFLRGMVTAAQFYTADAWFSVIDKLMMTLICGGMLYTTLAGPISLLRFLQVQSLCTALAVMAVMFFLYRRYPRNAGQPASSPALSLLKRSFPFALAVLLMSVHYRLDGFLLERLHPRGALEAGLYAAAYRLLDAGNMIGYLAASFLLPFFARHRNDRPLLQQTLFETRNGLLFIALAMAAFALFFSRWIQELLYHDSGAYASRLIALCVAVLPAYYLVHIYGSLLVAIERLRLFIFTLAGSVLLNLALNLAFMPSMGAEGCCWAALASQYACGLAVYIAATRAAGLGAGLASLTKTLVAAAFAGLLFYAGKAAVINVWIILAAAACLTLVMLAVSWGPLKKYFVSLR
ncbi:MAG TPA: polysaccharide biosynthesis C-terminal domain-containing protein [Flavisolibacter sp.]|nr:polysaccharide biosynthesis C-terminal domain-containing protein [Flavisolibacter sp.]